MERLTTRNSMGVAVYKTPYECETCNNSLYRLPDYGNGSPTDRLAEYEEAEEQGLILKPPCKVGDTVWCALEDTRPNCGEVFEATVTAVEWKSDNGFYVAVEFKDDEQPHGGRWFLAHEFGNKIFFGINAKKAEHSFSKAKIQTI